MVFDATVDNISAMSWRSVLLREQTGLLGENHSHTLSHKVVSSKPHHAGFELTTLEVIGTDWTGSRKSNYHIITAMTAPKTESEKVLTLYDFFFSFCYFFVNNYKTINVAYIT